MTSSLFRAGALALVATLLQTLLAPVPARAAGGADTVADARSDARRQRLAATLFGATVGEVRLTLVERADEATLLYRSDLTVVRDTVRLRQRTAIEARFHPITGALVHTSGRRCTAEEKGSGEASCVDAPPVTAKNAPGAVPALAAELVLSRREPTEGKSRDGWPACVEVVDEFSGRRGSACATVQRRDDGVIELDGEKLGQPFRARVRDGMLEWFEAPGQGARFTAVTGPVLRSGADLFADPVPSVGNVTGGLRRGVLSLRVEAPAEVLSQIAANAPGQQVILREADEALVELRQITPPRSPKAAKELAHAALLVAKARGSHVDCQAATDWFVAQARRRGWTVEPVVGVAWVHGRFAFHAWAVIDVEGHRVPVDPLLAQVPADAGHLQLGSEAGAVFLAARKAMRLEVVKTVGVHGTETK